MSTATYTFTPNRATLQHLTRDVNGPVGRALTRLGNQMVNEAKARANVDTGLMRSRIDFTIEPGPAGQLRLVLAARTNYSAYVHDGTRWYRGNPFLTDAARIVLARL
jgi:hypothetical protein